MRKITIIVVALLFFSVAIMPFAVSATAKNAQENVYIGPEEVINKNLFKSGNVVIIEGQINGDLFVAGNLVTIKGPVAGSIFVAGNNISILGDVEGSVFAAGSNVIISGLVGGSVRTAGSSVTVSSQVAKNVFMAGSNVVFSDTASAGWDLLSAGANVGVAGLVMRDAEIYGESVSISSQIGNDVKAELGSGSLNLLPTANIGGNLSYKGQQSDQLVVSEGAVIVGETTFNMIQTVAKKAEKINWAWLAPAFIFMKIMWLFSMIIVGLVLVALMPKPIKHISEEMIKKPWPSIGWGLIYLIVTPIVAVILMITLIGLPLGVILMVGYFIALYLVKIIAAIFVGAWIMGKVVKKKEPGLIWSLIIGAIVVMILTAIPVIGWLIKLILVIWALGATVTIKKNLIKVINK